MLAEPNVRVSRLSITVLTKGSGRESGDKGNKDRMSLLSFRIRNLALRLKRKGITWCTERAGETQSSTVDEHGIDPTEADYVDSDLFYWSASLSTSHTPLVT